MVEKLAQRHQVVKCLMLGSNETTSKPVFFPESCPAVLQQAGSPCPCLLLKFSLWWKQNNMSKGRSKKNERKNDKNTPLNEQKSEYTS